MEDAHLALDNARPLGSDAPGDEQWAYYGVCDGHGGARAATMAKSLLPRLIIDDPEFARGVVEAIIRRPFAATDAKFWSGPAGRSGTTARRWPASFAGGPTPTSPAPATPKSSAPGRDILARGGVPDPQTRGG
jgi:hypothetical protein